MFRLKDLALAFLLTFACSLVAFAQPQSSTPVPIMTGSKTGSYYAFATQAARVCSQEVNLQVMESAGSTATLDAMEANETALGISQLDILDLYKKTKDMSGIKVLVPLFPEQVHFITRNNVVRKEGGHEILGLKFGGNDVPLQFVTDLTDKKVAAAGGSFKTLQIVSYLGGIRMDIQDSKTADAAIAGVLAGTYDAAVLVGAQPLKTITAMGAKQDQLRLLPVPDALMQKLSAVYTKANPLTYRGMGAGGDNVPTVQVMSAMVTQNYPKSAMGDAVYALQQCLLREAVQQATVPGNHPAWRNLRTSEGINWPTWSYAVAPAVVKKK